MPHLPRDAARAGAPRTKRTYKRIDTAGDGSVVLEYATRVPPSMDGWEWSASDWTEMELKKPFATARYSRRPARSTGAARVRHAIASMMLCKRRNERAVDRCSGKSCARRSCFRTISDDEEEEEVNQTQTHPSLGCMFSTFLSFWRPKNIYSYIRSNTWVMACGEREFHGDAQQQRERFTAAAAKCAIKWKRLPAGLVGGGKSKRMNFPSTGYLPHLEHLECSWQPHTQGRGAKKRSQRAA